MRSLKLFLFSVTSVGLLFLGACSSGNQTAKTESSPAASPSTAASAPANETMAKTDGDKKDNDHGKQKRWTGD